MLRDKLRNTSGALHSLNDTALLLMQLDLLITIDTSVAHLAGTLDVATLLLVPFSCPTGDGGRAAATHRETTRSRCSGRPRFSNRSP